MKQRIGIYPGTFDPVHSGHIAFAEEAMRRCSLSEVVFIPEQLPRDKEHVTDLSHRIALIECAVAGAVGLRTVRLASKQFTIEQTLPELHEAFADKDLTLLIGSDVARTLLYRWEKLETLLINVSLAVGVRSTDKFDEIVTIMNVVAHEHDISVHYTLISTPESAMASSQIRNGTTNMSSQHPEVLAYMRKHQLYGW